MVENLLDFSALEAGRMTLALKPVRVAKTVEVVRQATRALLAEHPLTVEVPDDLAVRADHDALDRVLRNLLGNAAKYSGRGRPIVVRAAPDGEGRVRIEVTDQGVGIPEEQLGLVFERLYRAPGAAFLARGTGVGLNMVRRYTELMGGEVTVRSKVGEGSTFTVVLAAAG
jgi:signal transduction histidine kinase